LITAFEPIPTDNIRPMRFMGIAEKLLEKGHDVTIITSSFTPHNNSHRFSEDKNIRLSENYNLKILKSKGYDKKISIKRYFAHLDFANKLKKELNKGEFPDLIYISLPPIDTVYKSIKFAKFNKIPIIVDIIDPWPDVFLRIFPNKIKFLGKLFFFPFYYQIKYIFKNANGIISISNKYKNWAKKYNKNNVLSQVFYPAVTTKSIQINTLEKTNNSTIKFVYAGALSNSYDVETIIKAAITLNKRKVNNIEFYIAGNGPKLNQLKQQASNSKNIFFTGYLGSEQLEKLLTSCDFGIACYAKNSTQSVTYKLFDYLSYGLPIICSLPGEMSDIIVDENVGFFFNPENDSELVSIISHILNNSQDIFLMKKRALELTKKIGDKNIVYNELVEFVEKIYLNCK